MTDSARKQPPQQPPPVQRLQLRYVKRGRARFTSHRDVARALERALRRAGVPMAYSSGFNPHPRISYAGASATGAATEADFAELGLAEAREPSWVAEALTDALPDGLDIVEVIERVPGDTRSLVDRLTASKWRTDIAGPTEEVVAEAVAAFLAASEVPVERLTKAGVRAFDARRAVLELTPLGERSVCLVLRQESPLVRPDDVLQALGLVDARFLLTASALHTRLAQGEWDGHRIVGPFEVGAIDS